MKEQYIKKDHILTGNMVSVDHYILRSPCRLFHKKRKSDTSEIFLGRCDFIYHVSGYIIIKHQVAIKATETFQPKLTFEREDQSQGVAIKQYHTNNGIFNYSDFI